jgi:hypothetical protein
LAVFTVVGGTNGHVVAPALEAARLETRASSNNPTTLAANATTPAGATARSSVASSTPTRSLGIRPSTRPAPIQLAAAPRVVTRQMSRHRRALDLAQQGHRDAVARTLRGAGHPHSASLAAHFEDQQDLIQLIGAEGDRSILSSR